MSARWKTWAGTIFLVGLSLASGQEGPVDTTDSAVGLPVAAVGGAVLQVNDGAITSLQVIATFETEELIQWGATLDETVFVLRVRDQVIRASMLQVYNVLLFQHAMKDLSKNANYEAMIEAAVQERRRGLLAPYEGSEARATAELQGESSLEKKLEDFQQSLVIESYRRTHFEPTLEITRHQMLRYYRKHLMEKYTRTAEIRFQLIDIRLEGAGGRERAQAALQKVSGGEKFDAAVREYSQGFRKEQDGVWGPYAPEDLREQYQPVVQALAQIEVSQITGIVEGDGRLFIAKLLDSSAGGPIPFSQVQQEIHDALSLQQWQKYRLKLDQALEKKATIGDVAAFARRTTQFMYEWFKPQ